MGWDCHVSFGEGLSGFGDGACGLVLAGPILQLCFGLSGQAEEHSFKDVVLLVGEVPDHGLDGGKKTLVFFAAEGAEPARNGVLQPSVCKDVVDV